MKKPSSLNRRRKFSSAAARALAVLAVIFLTGCASMSPKGEDAVLLDRAQQRWDAVIAKDWDAAYALHSPGYRSATSRVDFEILQRSKPVRYSKAEYRSHACEGDRCEITFGVVYEVQRPVPGVGKWTGPDTVKDVWIRTDGEWWYVPPK